jgi:hypothetical protein
MASYVLYFIQKEPLSFSYDSRYINFMQCVEYNNGEQPCLLIPAIQNPTSPTLRNHCMNQL